MRFIAIDTRYGHINPVKGTLLEMAAVIADTEAVTDPIDVLPTYHAYLMHEQYSVQPFVPILYQDTFNAIQRNSDPNDEFAYFIHPESLASNFYGWLMRGEFGYTKGSSITFAGQNYGMREFRSLISNSHGWELLIPHSIGQLDYRMLYVEDSDESLPSREECRKRAGFKDSSLKTCLESARELVLLLQTGFQRRKAKNG